VSVPAAIAIVAGAVAVTILLLAILRRRGGPLLIEPTRGTPMTTVVGTAFAVLLAFITFAAFQTYNGAKAGAQSEAVAVLEMSRTAALFHPTERDELRGDLICYGRAVVNQEWSAMRHGQSSVLVERWIGAYRGLFNRFDLKPVREQVALSELLTEARNRTDGRRERLGDDTPAVPLPLWLALILGGVVAVALQLGMADPRERLLIHGSMIGGVAAIVTAGLVLVNFLDHPYTTHAGGIQPTEMRQTLTMISEQDHGVRPPCSQDGQPLMS
jgi:hypothetical protein